MENIHHRLKNYLQEINNYYFFPALASLGVAIFLLEMHKSNVFLLGIIAIRIYCTKHRKIQLCCLLVAFLTLLSSGYLLIHEKKHQLDEMKNCSGKLTIWPDNIRVDGDRLQLRGKVKLDNPTFTFKNLAFYKLTSKEEKIYWQTRMRPVEISFVGSSQKPLDQINRFGFNYQKFLKQQKIYQIITVKKIHSISAVVVPIYRFDRLIGILRSWLAQHIQRNFGKQTAIYMNMLLLGIKQSEFSEIEETFSTLGILHLFSLSGMHATFFMNCLRYFLLRIGIQTNKVFWLQLLFAIFYSGMTGFSISVIRALLQMSFQLINQKYSLKLSSLDCWSLALIVHLLGNPYLLFTNAGKFSYFLSFFIYYILKIIAHYPSKWLKSSLLSLLLGITMIPLAGVTFYEWQVFSGLLTWICFPLFKKILLPIILSSFLFSFISKINIYIVILEQFFQSLTILFMRIEQFWSGNIGIRHFSFFTCLLIIYLLICFFNAWINKKRRAISYSICLLLVLNFKFLSPIGTVAIIDVGQGDSIFLQAPFHKENILIDTGGKLAFKKEEWAMRQQEKAGATYSVIPYLKSRGVTKLDKVFITHGDEDHFGDLLTISKKIKIKNLYFPNGTTKKKKFLSAVKQLSKNGTRCYELLAGDNIDSYFHFEFLSPFKEGIGENNDSLVMYTKIADKSFLFTGDLEIEGEHQLIKYWPTLTIDILKVGHHGSKTSSSPMFLDQLKPQEAIISCGRNNHFNHPNIEVLKELEKRQIDLFRTDQQGMIYYEWLPGSKLSKGKVVKKTN